MASYLGYEAPGATVRVAAEQEPSGDLAAALAQTPVHHGAPAIDASAWLAHMTPEESNSP